MGAEALQILRVLQDVHLVGGHDLGAGGKLRAVLPELLVDGVEVRHGVPALAAGDIHQVDQQPAPVDMPQKIVAQSGTLAGPLNDAGNIRHDKADAIVHIHHAQVGIEGGEMIVGNFGVRLAHHAE